MSRRSLVSSAAAAALALGTLALTGSPGAAAPPDPVRAAVGHLSGDATAGLVRRAGAHGRYDFIGVPAGARLDNPSVTSGTGVAAAAASHLARYGAALGTAAKGTSWVAQAPQASVTGDTVRYQQEVRGVPVFGGQVVLSLGEDRELTSALASVSGLGAVGAATVSEATASATAAARFRKVTGATGTVTSKGRWVLDPSLVSDRTDLPARTAWQLEVTGAPDQRRLVFVDDRTGAVLLDADTIAHAKERVVCDNANVPLDPDADYVACDGTEDTPVRTEDSGPSQVEDVETAFELGGEVYDTYEEIGVDLTDLIGLEQADGEKALAQTVRLCYQGDGGCPYENAFWNGEQMYYGEGFAVADDVVGHEMTHGVTERTSNLVYWGQSGAINESISDIMGEIVDHQHDYSGTDAADEGTVAEWATGEDLDLGEGFTDGIRDLADPSRFADPDRTSSPDYKREDYPYGDQDGVHSNSGVGNKTFYLISQGGSFNGQTITGIDGTDADLVKSAKLWLLVDQTLVSGSDYDDLGVVLQQSCAALQGSGVTTAADCESVRRAVLATELATTPVNNPQAPDAPATCPTGTTARTLFDSETPESAAASKYVADEGWSRDGDVAFGPVVHSGESSWGGESADEPAVRSLVAADGLALPAGQKSYLRFQQWRVMESATDLFGGTANYDGGTVEVDDLATDDGPAGTASLPWVNGPNGRLTPGSDNPLEGQVAFVGNSRGYVASRLDLSSYAGRTIKPQFTISSDVSGGGWGWYLDEVVVYTCDAVVPPTTPTTPTVPSGSQTVYQGVAVVDGKARVGKRLTADVAGWGPGQVTLTYQWLRNGKPVAGATSPTYKLKKKDQGKKMSVTVTGTRPGFTSATTTSYETPKVKRKARKNKA